MWGPCPIGSRYTKGGGRGFLAFVLKYAFPRMTQAAISPETLLQAGMGEAAATSSTLALICGHRIDKSIYYFLVPSVPVATKRTIL